MQQVLVGCLWVLFSFVAGVFFLNGFPVKGLWSDLLFYFVVLGGFRFSFAAGLITAALLGYIGDAVSAVPNGVTFVSYVLTFLAIRKVRENVYVGSRISLYIWVFVFSLIKQLIQIFCLSLGILRRDVSIGLFAWTLLQALWDAALALFLLPALEKAMFMDWGTVFRRKGLKS